MQIGEYRPDPTVFASAFAAAGPILYPLILRAWTAMVPTRALTSWFLAHNSASYRHSQSSAAIGLLMVAVALTGGLYTTALILGAVISARTGRDTTSIAPEGVVLILGGPLLLSGIAAATTVFMSGHARERELALVQATGSTHGTILLAALWEGVIYTGTAVLLGTAATAIGGFITATAIDIALPGIAIGNIALIAGGGLVLLLAATLFPTVATLRHEIPRTLAVE